MTESNLTENTSVEALSKAFLAHYPKEAARKLELMEPRDTAEVLRGQPIAVAGTVLRYLSPGVLDNILLHCPGEVVAPLLTAMETGPCAALLNRLPLEDRERFLSLLDQRFVDELRESMQYPPDSAGSMMDTRIIAFNQHITVHEAITQLRNQKTRDLQHLFLLDDDMYLRGRVAVQKLALAEDSDKLAALASPLRGVLSVFDPKSEVMEKLERMKIDTLPVIDGNDHFVGVIRGGHVLGDLKETLVVEMQTMVGVSKHERALSSSWFAVKKRLPWLQINLLTAFLAATVVGMFEATIAQYTALAVLLPIAAGQSGNTGAQALAVTMRGITLREITVRHWLRVVAKETVAALINGLAVAATCGVGVYLWSRSTGLALIIALAMVTSMLIAAISGALVPIILKRLGQDPALSSSIILTTVTDIAGFLSFLGIATMLSSLL